MNLPWSCGIRVAVYLPTDKHACGLRCATKSSGFVVNFVAAAIIQQKHPQSPYRPEKMRRLRFKFREAASPGLSCASAGDCRDGSTVRAFF